MEERYPKWLDNLEEPDEHLDLTYDIAYEFAPEYFLDILDGISMNAGPVNKDDVDRVWSALKTYLLGGDTEEEAEKKGRLSDMEFHLDRFQEEVYKQYKIGEDPREKAKRQALEGGK